MYNICLIGHGYWGEKLARNFNNSEFFKLVSVVDKKNANLNLAKKKYPSIRHYKDYKIAINCWNIQYISINCDNIAIH